MESNSAIAFVSIFLKVCANDFLVSDCTIPLIN